MSVHFVLKSIVGAMVTATAVMAVGMTPASAAPRSVYAALGDSQSSGIGAGPYDLDAGCGRSSRAYAPLLAAKLHATAFKFLACSGATTGEITDRQVPAIPSAARLVTVTAGGNDVGFSAGFGTCLQGTDEDCTAVTDNAKSIATNQLPALLDTLFAAVRRQAPRAEVVIAGYPRFFDGAAECAAVPLSRARRDAIDSATDVLDSVIAQRARRSGVRYADTVSRFAGHSICSSEPWINGLVADGAFHPNAAGYSYGLLPAVATAVCQLEVRGDQFVIR